MRRYRSKYIGAIWLLALMGFITGLFLQNSCLTNLVWAVQTPGELTASLDRKSARIGDTVWLILKYRLPEGETLPEKVKLAGIEGLTIVEQTVEPNQIRIKLFIDRLEAWQTDAVTLSFKDKAGGEQTLSSGPVSLTVELVLGEKPADAQLRPIRDIIFIRGFLRTHWPWLACLAVFFLVLLGAYLWSRKRRSAYTATDKMEPPYARARKAIEALERGKVFEKGDIKTYYFTFSEIMRRYLESIRHFPAAEYTTEEISRQIQLEVDRKLLPLLRQADLVKFADTVPTPARKEEDVRLALSYIDETRPPSDGKATEEASNKFVGERS